MRENIAAEQAIDPRLWDILECPRCRSQFESDAVGLTCASGHRYPVINGVPVFVLPEKEQTIGIATNSYNAALTGRGDPLFIDTLGLSETERIGVETAWQETK